MLKTHPPKGKAAKRGNFMTLVLLAIVALWIWVISFSGMASRGLTTSKSWMAATTPARHPTMVIYVFSASDEEYEKNLRYFIQHGIREKDNCDYFLIFQTNGKDKSAIFYQNVQKAFGRVPDNVHFLVHPNFCFDWGTFGWFVRKRLHKKKKYTYFVFMNSSVRGPFLPEYYVGHWTEVFTAKISDSVKLVGPTISCEGMSPPGSGLPVRKQPHVQSYVVATDQVGLQVLENDLQVFKCHVDIGSTVYYAELGVSRVVLNAGYNIASLMVRYEGIDFRDTNNWNCAQSKNPYIAFNYDGLSIHPFEAVFVKIKASQLAAPFEGTTAALKYEKWRTQPATTRELQSNEGETELHLKLARVMGLSANPKTSLQCFDADYYRQRNHLPPEYTNKELYSHFIKTGQFIYAQARFYPDCKGEQLNNFL